jgi:hypothetical protein
VTSAEKRQVSRFRLRFHLQEIDLRTGVTTLGRSEECEVTIEDPLVSRRHAQIAVDGDEVKLIDLGSRNGVRVNGRPVSGSQVLEDGDRVRIGTQDLVFTRVVPRAAAQSHNRTTGVLRLCAQCKLPFARETTACPHCGASEQMDEDTLSGTFGHESQHSWSVQLLLEATDKALGMGRVPDADRMLRRATGLFEDRLAEGGKVEAEQVARASMAATAICEAAKDVTWGRWILRFYPRAGLTAPEPVMERLKGLVNEIPELARVFEEPGPRRESDTVADGSGLQKHGA